MYVYSITSTVWSSHNSALVSVFPKAVFSGRWHLLTVDKISECWTLALELLAHSEENRDDDVKDVDSVCCGTGSQATTKTNMYSTAENNTIHMKNIWIL